MTAGPIRSLFGTDGLRGAANDFLTPDLALALGRAATARAAAGEQSPQVLVVRDTRVSGEMLEAALCAGITAAGGDALLGGVLPTPAAPLLARRHGLDLAVVVSASHNPYHDNGIKFFGSDGMKLSNEAEAEIEAALEQAPPGGEVGRVRRLEGALEDYLRLLEEAFPLDLAGTSVLLDCANGATYRAAPLIFERLGAGVDVVAAEPDGRNINEGCGSTHLETLIAALREGGQDVGFAFDGDGDRVLAVDRRGEPVDGDELIALCALHLRERGELRGDGVVVTVMTNYGFHTAMREAGIEVATTQVGDRYVLEEMRRRDWVLGGEQSGHVIDLGHNTTGDGIATALLTLAALKARGQDLSERDAMRKLPQRLVNVPVAEREALEGAAAVWEVVEREQGELEGRGRVLVRPSGTEPLVRVMVEAPAAEECDAVTERLVAVVDAELGGALKSP